MLKFLPLVSKRNFAILTKTKQKTQFKAQPQKSEETLSFSAMQLLPELVTVLEKDFSIKAPTACQSLAIPHFIHGNSGMLAA